MVLQARGEAAIPRHSEEVSFGLCLLAALLG